MKALAYLKLFRFPLVFTAIADSVAGYLLITRGFSSANPLGILLVAYLRDAPIGCGALKHHQGPPSDVKRMWVAESARGLGIGRRLLAELESRAAEHGDRTVRLETNATLVEAMALYRSVGYVEVPAFNDEPFADHWFEKAL